MLHASKAFAISRAYAAYTTMVTETSPVLTSFGLPAWFADADPGAVTIGVSFAGRTLGVQWP